MTQLEILHLELELAELDVERINLKIQIELNRIKDEEEIPELLKDKVRRGIK